MPDDRAPRTLWRSVRALPEFRRLLELRAVSQFGDGLFQAGIAGAILFNPEREAEPWAIAAAFAVLFLPYSLLGPFAGALLDRWDRRLVLIGANCGRLVVILVVGALLSAGLSDIPILLSALLANGFTRFVSSGLSAALPHVVPRDQVIAMNSVATATTSIAAFAGAIFMLLPRWLFGAGDSGASVIIFMVAVPVSVALWLSMRFPPRLLGPDDSARAVHGSVLYAVATGWLHGARTVLAVPSVSSTLSGLAAHRMVFGVNTLLVLVMVRHTEAATVAGFGTTVLFVSAGGAGQFLATVVTPTLVKKWGRYATPNGALAFAAAVQLCGATLNLPVMIVCGFLLGAAGQVVKLCADTAMQIDVEDALRGHLFAVQDALFWLAFIVAISAAAFVIPPDGRSVGLAVAGVGTYLAGLAVHATVGRRGRPRG
ncbi:MULTISPECIES: MFS transporter [Mycolicibacterium]|uniref:Major facilitator superfamily MFS_1 n=2 Tax=Mycolicibacterium TaxID=1866885 RepID=A1TI10_MYCVP|nr:MULTISPECIES: MFS transporter [Mycolicibacterium]ABM16810.1 major facilitator superfamily MFS_1 [Mycolicibacterium vanbaalenii PYR-1]MCV7130683.1 MFS transporter [Mycolicibacterium vanbaalenii PYR-1]MDN4522658.1 MFS transporter [Mycolicibacterium austroafricanum]QRZ06983.1 MFS transporter [Mycolicibacterium austroafricanum]QZT57067.1 MFS transporter [Mycolicibacterium austroafricanum]